MYPNNYKKTKFTVALALCGFLLAFVGVRIAEYGIDYVVGDQNGKVTSFPLSFVFTGIYVAIIVLLVFFVIKWLFSTQYRNAAINTILLVSSILAFYVFIETFFFRLFLPTLPLRSWGYIDEHLLPLAQSSKRGTIPQDYIMLVGDSYAQGLGDWFIAVDKNRNSDFHSAHIIHHRTGRDVISTGTGGIGSLHGIITNPIGVFEFINASLVFKLEPPEQILVYFYEGNDLNNNLAHLRAEFNPMFDQQRIYDPAYFREFIEKRVRPDAPKSSRLQENLFVSEMVSRMVRRTGRRTVRYENRHPERERTEIAMEAINKAIINKALINGKEMSIPDRLQSPALELTDDEIRLALYAFEQALRYLQEYFPTSAMKVVYIPSVLSSYQIVSPQVSIQTYEDRASVYPGELVRTRSDLICARIESIAGQYQIPFIDARPEIWKVSATQVIHGPLNWKHFNQVGYTALAEAIIPFIEKKKGAR